MTTSKLLWNSVISTDDARFAALNVGNFYLETPLERYEYMRLPLKHFPQHTIDQYNLRENAKHGWVYIKIRKAIYGLPQAGKLANKQLKEHLGPAGYYEVAHTPGLFTHVTRPIQFSLVVDDFGVKYVGKEHSDHLIKTLEHHYDKISVDWERNYTAVSPWSGITTKGFSIFPCRAT